MAWLQMTKTIKKLEKDRAVLQKKCEKTDITLIEMAEEVRDMTRAQSTEALVLTARLCGMLLGPIENQLQARYRIAQEAECASGSPVSRTTIRAKEAVG